MEISDQVLKKLRSSAGRAEAVRTELEQAELTCGMDFMAYAEHMASAALGAELLARNLRRLLIETAVVTREAMMIEACEISGYRAEQQGEEIVITLPALPLKERTYRNCGYVVKPLYYCLSEFCFSHDVPHFEKARIEIRHIYPETAARRFIRDYDNLEVKKVLDAVTVFFLKDDSMLYCDVLHTAEAGEDYRTVITLSPRS